MILENEKLPEESTSQRIGQDAIRAFYNAHPLSWRPKDLSGDDDAGLDFQVQVTRKDQYWTVFCAQLKSSRSPRVTQTEDAIAISLKTSTLNYYANITNPLLLAFVDLSVNADPRKCPVYYVWIHDELRILLAGRHHLPDDQETHTFKIPRKNVLDPNLDVEPYLTEYLTTRRAADGLFGAVAASAGGGPQATLKLASRIERQISEGGPSLLTSLTEDSEAPWLNVTLGPIAKELRRISELLDNGSDSEAERALSNIALDEASSHEHAEFYTLMSRCAEFRGDSRAGAKMARLAYKTRPDLGRYLARRVENSFRRLQVSALPRLAKRLLRCWPEINSPPAIATKAKLLALNNRFDEALIELGHIPSDRSCTTVAIIYFLKRDWSTVVAHVDRSLSELKLNAIKIRVLNLFASAALFRLATPDFETSEIDYVMPVTGSPSTKADILYKCWERSKRTLQMMKIAGWPSETEFLIEPLCLSAIHLNYVRDIYEDIWDIVKIRPHCTPALVSFPPNFVFQR